MVPLYDASHTLEEYQQMCPADLIALGLMALPFHKWPACVELQPAAASHAYDHPCTEKPRPPRGALLQSLLRKVAGVKGGGAAAAAATPTLHAHSSFKPSYKLGERAPTQPPPSASARVQPPPGHATGALSRGQPGAARSRAATEMVTRQPLGEVGGVELRPSLPSSRV